MFKGDLVKLNVKTCFTKANGGDREYPITTWHNDANGLIYGVRKITSQELDEWHASGHGRGLDDAGETILAPSTVSVAIDRNDIFVLIRKRCAPVINYTTCPGYAEILSTKTNVLCFVKRELLELA